MNIKNGSKQNYLTQTLRSLDIQLLDIIQFKRIHNYEISESQPFVIFTI